VVLDQVAVLRLKEPSGAINPSPDVCRIGESGQVIITGVFRKIPAPAIEEIRTGACF